MDRRTKRIVLLCLIITIVVVGLLASSLPRVQFEAGRPFRLLDEAEQTGGGSPVTPVNIDSVIIQGIMAISLILIPVFLIMLFFSKRWKKHLQIGLMVLIAALLIAAINTLALNFDNPIMSAPAAMNEELPPIDLEAPPVQEFTGSPPLWLGFLVALFIFLLVAVVIIAFLRSRRRHVQAAMEPDPIAEQAEMALAAIHSGRDVRGVVIDCYSRMCDVLLDERGISRDPSMTPREFQNEFGNWLAKRGVPTDAIKTLTGLFEQVRYSPSPATEAQEQQAVECLSAISSTARRRNP